MVGEARRGWTNKANLSPVRFLILGIRSTEVLLNHGPPALACTLGEDGARRELQLV